MNSKTNAKIRIRLESFNHELLAFSCKKIVKTFQNRSSSIVAVSLPTRKRIYCVLRSPHVDKDSREHFEIRIHKRILEIYDDLEISKHDTCFKDLKDDLPAGVFYEVCIS
jgi:small subunit ribosomal protein S10